MHTALAPFTGWDGAAKPRVLFLGEAWGAEEEPLKRPFVGASGKEFWLVLGEAWPEVFPELHVDASRMHPYGSAWVRPRRTWLDAASVAFTNVLAFRPPDNKIEKLCTKRAEADKNYPYPAIRPSLYLRQDIAEGELARLDHEIREAAPTLVVALGATAIWALLRRTDIGSIRGSTTLSVWPPGFKVLPTYHPANVLYQWSNRPILGLDLMKALRESAFAEIRRPRRSLVVDPTLEDVKTWTSETLARKPPRLSCDTETAIGQITHISFARSPFEGLSVPFAGPWYEGGSYWRTLRDEVEVIGCCKALLEDPDIEKVFQNTLYDLQYTTHYGIMPRRCTADPMLLHHSMWPEMPKSLGFLGSLHTDEASWKLMRRRRKSASRTEGEKRDE